MLNRITILYVCFAFPLLPIIDVVSKFFVMKIPSKLLTPTLPMPFPAPVRAPVLRLGRTPHPCFCKELFMGTSELVVPSQVSRVLGVLP